MQLQRDNESRGSGGAASITREVRVDLEVAGRTSSLYGSQGDVDSFLRSLEEARRSAGGG